MSSVPEFTLGAMSPFERYCYSFYGPRSLYPIEGLTPFQLETACRIRTYHRDWCGGDSFDREAVRDWLLKEFPTLRWRSTDAEITATLYAKGYLEMD